MIRIQRVSDRIQHIGSGVRMVAPRGGVEAAPWWLSGGILAANCIAAYQPKGAASYAASKVNLANPGTYDATEGTAPDWDAVNGWGFVLGSSEYLITGITPGSGWSAFCQFSEFAVGQPRFLFGSINIGDDQGMGINPSRSDDRPIFYNGGRETLVGGGFTTGNAGVAGQYGYKDGVSVTAALAAWSTTVSDIYIGAYNRYGAGVQGFATVKIKALSIYNTVITGDQITALTAAMAAL